LEILKKEVEPIIQEIKQGIEIEEYSTDMISYLIHDLTDLTKIKQGKFKKDLRKVDIKELVN
jgi:signal transduction histidine kinase